MNDGALKERIKRFADNLRKGYNKSNLVNIIANQKDQSAQTSSDSQFFQFPVRTKINLSDFGDNVNNDFFASELGDSIGLGEFNYITKTLSEHQKPSIDDEEAKSNFLEYLKKFSSDHEPEYILMPILTKYYDSLHNLFGVGLAKYVDNFLIITINGKDIKVIWSSKLRNFKDIFILEKDALTWNYKTHRDMQLPQNLNNYDGNFNTDEEKVSFLFNVQSDHVDIVARSVGRIEINEKKFWKITTRTD